MSKPYKEVKAGEPILAQDWNAIQSQIHEHVLTHTHTGTGENGAKIDLDIRALAAAADMSVRKLNAGEGLAVGAAGQPLFSVNPAATNQEGNYQVNVAGTLRADQVRTGRLDGVASLAVGDLAISGSAGIGTSDTGSYKLKVAGGETHLEGALTVDGAAKLNGGLAVNGNSALSGNVNVGETSKLTFGAKVRQMIELWSDTYGIGVQSSTQYFRTAQNFAWYKLGTHVDGELSAGTGGTIQMVIKDGNVGIGTHRPGQKLTVSSSAEHLQLRREETETTGGKLVFLELYQHDPNHRVPEVYPSIRFHHNDTFWQRIEARSDGFHLKVGDLAGDGYVNLRAGTVTATKFAGEGAFVTGMIVMWSGAVNQLPGGWALCDGRNGTPDLRARFVVGAGQGGNPEYAPGQSGEPDSHAHTVALPSTAMATSQAGAHNHAPPPEWYDGAALNGSASLGLSWINTIDRRGQMAAARTSSEGNHTHNVAVNVAGFNSGPSSGPNRPKWYALCFIMKL